MIYTDPKRIILFDTTLRDGEQALPQSLSAREKMQSHSPSSSSGST